MEAEKNFGKKVMLEYRAETQHSHNHRLLELDWPLEIILSKAVKAFVRPKELKWFLKVHSY